MLGKDSTMELHFLFTLRQGSTKLPRAALEPMILPP